LDKPRKGYRLSGDKTAPGIIKAFRAKLDGTDHPAWKSPHGPRALMERAKKKPGVRPSFQKSCDQRCFSDEVELQLAVCAKEANTNKEQWAVWLFQLPGCAHLASWTRSSLELSSTEW
jgi:hypothetical protein